MSKEYNSIQLTTNIEDIGPVVRNYECLDNSVFVIAELIFNAILYSGEYKYFLIGNEYSSNFGNAIYEGENVNHQYDKTVGFAKRINEYINKFVTPDFKYGSPFFGYYELAIGKKFIQKNNNFETWTSCNATVEEKNFCCDCSKCAFTFSILRPFTSREFLINHFGGDMLERLDLFLPLINLDTDKPLDCVGIKEEVWYSLYLLMDTEEKDTEVVSYFSKYDKGGVTI